MIRRHGEMERRSGQKGKLGRSAEGRLGQGDTRYERGTEKKRDMDRTKHDRGKGCARPRTQTGREKIGRGRCWERHTRVKGLGRVRT